MNSCGQLRRVLHPVAVLIWIYLQADAWTISVRGQTNELRLEELGYQLESWTTDDGVPGAGTVRFLAQDALGYVWVAANGGLARFDGVRFKTIAVGDFASYRTRLLFDSSGRLFFVNDAGVLMVYEGGAIRAINHDTDPDLKAATLLRDDSGNILAIDPAAGKVYILRDEAFHKIHDIMPIATGEPLALAVEGASVWAFWEDELLGLGPGKVERIAASDFIQERPIENAAFFRGSDGRLYLSMYDTILGLKNGRWSIIDRWPEGRIANTRFAPPWRDRFGTFWSGVRYDPDAVMVVSAGGRRRILRLPDSDHVRALMEDREGNIWIGALGGLYLLKRVPFRTPAGFDAIPGKRIVSIVTGNDGDIWLSSRSHTSRISKNSRSPIESWPLELDRIIEWSRDEFFWLVSTKNQVSTWSPQQQQVRPRAEIPGTENLLIAGLLESSDRALWIASVHGLFVLRDGVLSQRDIPEELIHESVFLLQQDSRGRIFAGNSRELHIRDSSGWRRIDPPPGQSDFPGHDMAEAPDGGIWLISMSGGLALWDDDQLRIFSPDQTGLPQGSLGIEADDGDGLWIGTQNQGVLRYSRRGLLALGQVPRRPLAVRRFNSFDGLPSPLTLGFHNGRGVCKSDSGDIWVATTKGPAFVTPSDWELLLAKAQPPQVILEEVLVDDEPIDVESAADGRRVEMAAGTHRIDIHFTGIDMRSSQEIRFRYRLNGYDNQWWDAGHERSIHYQGVPPGDYELQILAVGTLGIWSEEGLKLRVLVQPAWWQTRLFRVGSGLGLLVLIGLAYHWRVSGLMRQKALQRDFSRRLIASQEAERKRIAGELHDGLGQNLLVIKSNASLALRHIDNPAKLRSKLEEMATISAESVQEARNISHDLRPMQLDELGLTKAIESVLRKADEMNACDVESRVECVDGLLRPEFEISLYRVIQEGMNNIHKHARATRARVEIAVHTAKEIGVAIEDNGLGFDAEKVFSLSGTDIGMGLPSMRERVENMGGRFKVVSETGRGTRFEFAIPIQKEI